MTRMMMFRGMINRKILNQVNSTNHIKDVRLFLQSVDIKSRENIYVVAVSRQSEDNNNMLLLLLLLVNLCQ